MNEICGCCEGIEGVTPISTANRPGLDALVYRVGTHATFLETMKASLSSSPALTNLKTRDANDPAIALLDGWAMVADVLTFYQERIANEGYLRTANERRSVLELARLIGYSLRPGVAATVYPAFMMEVGYNKGSEISASTRIQSLPGFGEMPQFYETAQKIAARADWNNLQPRLTRPHFITQSNANEIETIYFQGITTNLKPNDPLLFIFGNGERQQFRQVQAVKLQGVENRTEVILQVEERGGEERENSAIKTNSIREKKCSFEKIGSADEGLLKNLLTPPSVPPANASRLGLSPKDTFSCESDIAPQLLASLKPRLADNLYTAWQNTPVTRKSDLQSTQALRVKASPFGASAPQKPLYDDRGRLQGSEEWAIAGTKKISVSLMFNSDFNPQQIYISLEENTDTQSEAVLLTGEFPRSINFNGQVIEVNFISSNTSVITVAMSDWSLRLTSQLDRNWSVIIKSDEEVTIAPNQTRRYSKVDTGKVIISFISSEPNLSVNIRSNAIQVPQRPTLWVINEYPIPSSAASRKIIALDAQYDQILPGSWVVIQRPNAIQPLIRQVIQIATVSKVDYSISAKVTQLTLNDNWLEETDTSLAILRQTTVYAQSEELELAQEVINPTDEPLEGNEIELDLLYDGLQPGRWLIVSGERADLDGTTKIKASELVMLLGVNQRAVTKVKQETQYLYQERPGDITHTFLQLSQSLNYKYKRDTVTVYGNVVKATQGETRTEVLGSGDSSKAFQQFTLRQPPLTYISAPTPVGAVSTLEVRVNDILWRETASLATLKPTERGYITKTDDDSKTTVIFGNGDRGARLPSGMENVRVVYRSGIGKAGNVKAEQINLLTSRPLGLKSVINPLPATGGADRENRDQARKNAPLAVMALDRLVSVTDYADFARTFAGIAKAKAMQLSDNQRQVLHLTIAGVDDIPIDKHSDLHRNLYQALRRFGDSYQPIQVELRELMVLIISAKVKILPDYEWEILEPQIRQNLLTIFSFENRELGQDVTLSEVMKAIQIPGVDFVDVDILDTISETEAADPTTLTKIFQKLVEGRIYLTSNNKSINEKQPRKRINVNLAKVANNKIQPAQLAILIPTEPRTLLLNPL